MKKQLLAGSLLSIALLCGTLASSAGATTPDEGDPTTIEECNNAPGWQLKSDGESHKCVELETGREVDVAGVAS